MLNQSQPAFRSPGCFAPALILLGCFGALVLPTSDAFAVCAPATGSSITVTCSGATVDQGPGTNTGYGNNTQDGLTLTVQSGASVAGTSIGIDVNNNNTINNFGTITTAGNGAIGDVWGINANGPLTVNNFGTIGRVDIPDNLVDLAGINTASGGLVVNNNAGGVIQGATAIQGFGSATVVNSGLINGIVGGGGTGISIFNAPLNLTNNSSGTITADAFAVTADSATITNYGTISAPGFGGTAINVNALTLFNYASGVITGDGGAISGSQTPTLTVTNFGTISGTGLGAFGISGNVVDVTNSGTISVASGSGGSAISMASGSIVNNAGASITGDFTAIASEGNTTIFNAGTISTTGGPAIQFAFFGGNTLTIAPTSVINGNVVATGTDTFQLGGTGTGAFNLDLIGAANQYQGFSTFNKIGGSTWTLTGTGDQAWTVQAGTLLVNGDLSAATGITVNAGGTLGGSGILPTTNVNGGVFAPGPGNAPGAITVSGDLSFQAGSTYLVQVSTSTASTTNVSGTASLAGTVLASILPGSYVTHSYTILTASGGFVGSSTFDNLVLVPSGFAASLGYTPTTVLLNLTAQLGLTGTFDQNQHSVANAINSFFNGGGTLPPGFLNLFNLTGGNLGNALTQLTGLDAGGASQAGMQLTSEFLALMLNPYSGSNGGNAGPLGFARDFGAGEAQLPPEAAMAYAAVTPKDKRANAFASRWGIWGGSFGGYGRTSGDTVIGSADTTARTYGFAAGADYRAAPDLVLGFALAGGGTNWGLAQGLGGGRSDAFLTGVYGSKKFGAAYVSGALSYAWHNATTDRTVTVSGTDQLNASFNANSFGGRLESGYRFAMPYFGITPYAALQVQNFRTPSYSESAVSGSNTFALSYGSRSTTATRTEFGSWFDKLFALDGGKVLTIRTRAAWANDHSNNAGINAAFQTLPGSSFTVIGAAAPTNSALLSAGAELRLANNVSISAKFDGEFANGSRTYAGNGTVRYVWRGRRLFLTLNGLANRPPRVSAFEVKSNSSLRHASAASRRSTMARPARSASTIEGQVV